MIGEPGSFDFHGYILPDPFRDSDEAERYFNEDLDRKGRSELVHELELIRNARGHGEVRGDRGDRQMLTTDCRPLTVREWLGAREALILDRLYPGKRKAASR